MIQSSVTLPLHEGMCQLLFDIFLTSSLVVVPMLWLLNSSQEWNFDILPVADHVSDFGVQKILSWISSCRLWDLYLLLWKIVLPLLSKMCVVFHIVNDRGGSSSFFSPFQVPFRHHWLLYKNFLILQLPIY